MKTKIFVLVGILTFVSLQNILPQEKIHKRDNCRQQCFNKLDLTEEQQEKVETMKLDHQMEMIDLKANLEKKKLGLADLKNNGNYTRDEYIGQIEQINSAKEAIAISKANFKMDVYEILDTDQKKEWNELSINFGERKEKRMNKSNERRNFN